MKIRQAISEDCRAIAELALMAGEGIPAYFWAQSRAAGEEIVDVGARKAASESGNFSYRNVQIALLDGKVAGMLLAYRLPDSEPADDFPDVPEFVRPLLELERCVPGSFYINMLATYPQYRGRGVGRRLMAVVDRLATAAGCRTIAVEVFEQNAGALRLYRTLGYQVAEERAVVPHSCHPYEGRIVLLTKQALPEAALP